MAKKEKSSRSLNLEEVRQEYMSSVNILCFAAEYAHQISKEEMMIKIEKVRTWQSELCKRFNAPANYEDYN